MLLASDFAVEGLGDGLVCVGTFASEAEAADHGLVILALGQPYWLVATDGRFQIFTAYDTADRARDQLAAYARESAQWPPRPIADPWTARPADVLTPLAWAAAIMILFQRVPPGSAAYERAALDAEAVVAHGELWRAATALFVHADSGHVIANAGFGLLVFTAVFLTLGTRRGALLTLLAAMAANLTVALLAYPAPYVSVGASTALFAGIGLLVGRALRLPGSSHPQRARRRATVLALGFIVLGLYGAGGPHVDLGAHAAGLLAGAAAGVVFGLPRASARRNGACRT